MTPDQSRAVAAWFNGPEIAELPFAEQMEIRNRVTSGGDPWAKLTTEERAKCEKYLPVDVSEWR